MKKHIYLIGALILTLGGLAFSWDAFAQPGAATCPPLIEAALDEMGNNCDGLGRNTACYGHTLVQATLNEDATEVAFSSPTDRAELELISSIRNSALDEENESWGITVMNTMANLPNTLPGQGVVMLLMGDTQVVSEVPPEVLEEPPSLSVEVTAEGARVRSGASIYNNVLGVLNPGDIVTVDGRSEDGEWLRVVYNDLPGWMFQNLLAIDADQLDSLSAVDDLISAPMQAVYFTSGIGNANCNQAPDALVIQSPRGSQVSLRVNQADITIGSTIALVTEGNVMILYVIEGYALVNNLYVPQGYKAYVDLAELDVVALIAALSELDLDAEELEALLARVEAGGADVPPIIQIVQSENLLAINSPWRSCATFEEPDLVWLSTLEGVPSGLLHYDIEMPPDEEAICASPEERQQILQQQQQQQQIVNGVDCRGFKGTSPTGGMSWGSQTFYWDAAPGASGYEVKVTDNNGNTVASGSSNGTSVTIDTGKQDDIGGVNYGWSVTALDANGDPACTTQIIEIPRGAAPSEWLERNSLGDGDEEPEEPAPAATEDPGCPPCECTPCGLSIETDCPFALIT